MKLNNHNRLHMKGMGMHPTFEIHMDKIWLNRYRINAHVCH